ncbi:MAG: flagellar export chaperone FlgN [Ignavibacteriales bacterium]|nr:flagellar export chaperone FlgN [Ignavibacteriales bacterium]
MSSQNLITTLKTQEANLDSLMGTLEEKKQAIIKNNYSLLNAALINEQNILHNIGFEEKNRLKVVQDLAKELNLELKDASLESILSKNNFLLKKENKEIQQLRKSLKEKIIRISNTNKQLKDVIDFSRSLIKDTIIMIAGLKKRELVNKRV